MIAHPIATADLSRLAPPPGMRGLYSIAEARLWLGGISRPTIYRLMASGNLQWRQRGGSRVIPWWALLDYQRRADDGELAGPVRQIARPAPQKKEALPLARKRTQTRNLRSSAKTLKSR